MRPDSDYKGTEITHDEFGAERHCGWCIEIDGRKHHITSTFLHYIEEKRDELAKQHPKSEVIVVPYRYFLPRWRTMWGKKRMMFIEEAIMKKQPTSNLMEWSRQIVNKLTKFDTSFKYRVSISFDPNPLNYDGIDDYEMEVYK